MLLPHFHITATYYKLIEIPHRNSVKELQNVKRDSVSRIYMTIYLLRSFNPF